MTIKKQLMKPFLQKKKGNLSQWMKYLINNNTIFIAKIDKRGRVYG